MPLQAQNSQNNTIIDADSITYAEEAGSYPVTFEYKDEKGKSVTTTVYITLLYLRTVISDTYSEGIDAYDIEVAPGMFAQLTDTDLIRLTNAHAWRTDNGAGVPVVMVGRATVNQKLGKYQVTFKTLNQTATTVNVIETRLATEKETVYSYFSFLETPYVWWNFYFIFLIMLIPLLIMLYNYFKMRKELKRVNVILYENKIT